MISTRPILFICAVIVIPVVGTSNVIQLEQLLKCYSFYPWCKRAFGMFVKRFLVIVIILGKIGTLVYRPRKKGYHSLTQFLS